MATDVNERIALLAVLLNQIIITFKHCLCALRLEELTECGWSVSENRKIPFSTQK